MKIFYTYFLLLAILARPLYTVGYTAYFGLNIEEIIEKYCENKDKPQLQCNGKCHLAKQLNMTASDDLSSVKDFLPETLIEIFTPVFFSKQINILPLASIEKMASKSLSLYTNHYFFKGIYKLLRPPKL